MNILLNGKSHEIEAGSSLSTLLSSLGLDGKPVVVELDEIAVFPRDYAETAIPAGARVELVTLAAGG